MVAKSNFLQPSRFIILILVLFSLIGCDQQNEYPNRPITFICPWSAGGGTDRISRQIASQLEREMGVPVNVINATGGAGVTGHTRGALARPNGYNITMVTEEINMLHWRGLTNITYEDFEPLMGVNKDNAALFVRQDAPWDSLKDLENAIRENPGELQASGTAFGGVWHISLAGWLLEAGLAADAATWISINGSAPSLQELMAGGVDMVSCSFPEAKSLYDAGEIRSLGVMADERLDMEPGIPTFKEQGYDWKHEPARGLMVPPGVPDDRYEILLEGVKNVIYSEEYASFLENSGFGAGFMGPDEYWQTLKEKNQTYEEIFKSEAFQSVVSQQYGPMLFPNLLMGLMVIAIVILIFSGNLKLPESAQAIKKPDLSRMAVVMGGVVLYLLLAEQLGFVVTAAIILALLLWQFRVKWSTALLIIVIAVPIAYQLFAVYLRVPLPWGLIGW